MNPSNNNSNKSHSEEPSLKSKLPCNQCGKSKKTNSLCKFCRKAICLIHSTILSSTSEERVCDICFEDYLVQNLPDIETTVQEIRENVQRVIDERELNTKELSKVSTSLMYKQNEIIEKEENFQIEENSLNEKVKETKENLKKLEKIIINKNKDLEKVKNDVEYATKKIEDTSAILEKFSEEEKKHTVERNIIFNELNELQEFIKMQVPIRLLKKIVCPMCYNKVYLEYQKAFRPESAKSAKTSTEIRRSSVESKQSKGACSSCILY